MYKKSRVHFKDHFSDAYIGSDDLEQTSNVAGYGQARNFHTGANQEEMEHTFINFDFSSAMRDADFMKLTTTNANLTIQIQMQAEHIWALQCEIYNLKVGAAATKDTDCG